MKTIQIISLSGLVSLCVCGWLTAADQGEARQQTFDWASKPKMNPDQQKLLQLHNQVDHASEDSARIQSAKGEIERLAEKLGLLSVRPARPGELLVTRVGESGQAAIYNPSETNLAFTVAVKGDEEWQGSRKASIGRQTYLPPKRTLSLTNLYWTTPRMTERK